MDFNEIDIHDLLPQKEPFVAVGKLLHFSMERTVTATTIYDTSIFTENGMLTAPGIIENIAQTCATRIGYINKFILKRGIQIGYIGAIRNFRLLRCPNAGETLVTTIETEEEVFGMTLVKASVVIDNELIAEASMKIAVNDKD